MSLCFVTKSPRIEKEISGLANGNLLHQRLLKHSIRLPKLLKYINLFITECDIYPSPPLGIRSGVKGNTLHLAFKTRARFLREWESALWQFVGPLSSQHPLSPDQPKNVCTRIHIGSDISSPCNPARALRALVLLLADSALTVGWGKTFWGIGRVPSRKRA